VLIFFIFAETIVSSKISQESLCEERTERYFAYSIFTKNDKGNHLEIDCARVIILVEAQAVSVQRINEYREVTSPKNRPYSLNANELEWLFDHFSYAFTIL
jgi:hypothetical protein